MNTLVLEIYRLKSCCCKAYEPGEVDSLPSSRQIYINHAYGRGEGIDCVLVFLELSTTALPSARVLILQVGIL